MSSNKDGDELRKSGVTTPTSIFGSDALSSMSSGDEHDVIGPYILFTDNTENMTILYISPSITNNLGWTPEEMVGKSCYVVVHPDDFGNLRTLLNSDRRTLPVAQMVQVRLKHKDPSVSDDGYLMVNSIINCCYDCFVVVSVLVDSQPSDLAWRASAEHVVRLSSGRIAIENWNHRSLIKDIFSDQFYAQEDIPVVEPRVVLILNRFTKDLTILFSSQASNEVLGNVYDSLVGRSIFDFIPDSERESVRKAFRHCIESDLITRITCTWRSRIVNPPLRCEAIVTSTWDGLVCIMRQHSGDHYRKVA